MENNYSILFNGKPLENLEVNSIQLGIDGNLWISFTYTENGSKIKVNANFEKGISKWNIGNFSLIDFNSIYECKLIERISYFVEEIKQNPFEIKHTYNSYKNVLRKLYFLGKESNLEIAKSLKEICEILITNNFKSYKDKIEFND